MMVLSQKFRLKLMNSFADFFDQQNLIDDRIIYGFSENGKYVYLKDFIIIIQTSNIPGLDVSDYLVNSLFISSQPIALIDNLNIIKSTFSFDSYERWNQSSPITISINKAENSESVNYGKENLKSIEGSFLIEVDTMEFSKRAILSRRHIDGFTKFEISLKKF
ncbi:hypothetical protein EMLAB_20620 [Enterococcus mundtii]|nr:hypothetical protein EMLAB_20620 [Enterococcus mundtii]